DGPDRAPEVPLGDQPQEARHIHADGAAGDARLVSAGEAPQRLGPRLGRRVGEGNLADVLDAFGGGLLGPEDLRKLATLLVGQGPPSFDSGPKLFGAHGLLLFVGHLFRLPQGSLASPRPRTPRSPPPRIAGGGSSGRSPGSAPGSWPPRSCTWPGVASFRRSPRGGRRTPGR